MNGRENILQRPTGRENDGNRGSPWKLVSSPPPPASLYYHSPFKPAPSSAALGHSHGLGRDAQGGTARGATEFGSFRHRRRGLGAAFARASVRDGGGDGFEDAVAEEIGGFGAGDGHAEKVFGDGGAGGLDDDGAVRGCHCRGAARAGFGEFGRYGDDGLRAGEDGCEETVGGGDVSGKFFFHERNWK